MTRTEWIAARRAMLARATKGRWTRPKNCLSKGAVGYEDGPWQGIHLDSDHAADADLIVAAVNEQEAVVRLVEAAIRMRADHARLRGDAACDDVDAALAALVGEQEKSG